MRQHPTSTNVINMFVLDFEVVNRGGAGAREFLLDPDGVAGEVLESFAKAQVHCGDVAVTVLGPDRMMGGQREHLNQQTKIRIIAPWSHRHRSGSSRRSDD